MNRTVGNLLYFFFAVVLVKIIGTLTTFLLARILSPADYGLWVTLLIVGSFSSIICFGTIEALVKMYPYYAARSDDSRAHRLESNVFGSIFLSGLLLVAAATVFFVLTRNFAVLHYATIIKLMIITAGMGLFSAFFYYRFTAHQQFKMVSLIDSLRALTLFALVIFFSHRWGLKGAVIGFALNEALILAFSLRINDRKLGKVRARFDWHELSSLVAIGFPITVIWWVYMLLTSVDRMLSMALLGREATGYYGLGTSIMTALVLIPMVLGRVLYPKVNEVVGREAGQSGLREYVVVPARTLSLLLPLIAGPLFIILPEVYRLFFPAYLKGVLSARILLGGVYFICLIRTGVNYLIAIDRQMQVLAFVIISLVVNVIATLLLVTLGLGIEGISIGTSLAGMVLALLLWKTTFAALHYSRRDRYQKTAELCLPFILCLALCCGIARLNELPAFHDLRIQLLSTLLFVILYAAMLTITPPLNRWVMEIRWQVRNKALATRVIRDFVFLTPPGWKKKIANRGKQW